MMMEPKIRLNGFSGEWENTSLGQAAFDFKYGINAAAKEYDGHNKYLRITDIDDSSREFCYEDLTSPNTDLTNCNDYLMKVGDIVVARTGASVGKTYKYREKDGTVYFAGFLIRFTANNDYDSDFVFYNTLTKGYDKHIKLVSQRSGQPGVNVSELQSFAFNAPSLPEQRALATFFTSLDNQISAAEKRLASLKQVKAASLQAMFPQEGETTPKLRFKGCEGEWKKVKLGECGTFSKGKGYSKADICAEGTPIILYGSMYTNYSTIIDKVDTYAKMNDGAVLSKGGEIIIPASGETPEDIAIASVVKRDGILLGGDLNIITLGEGYDPTFIALGITYSKTHVELSKYAQGKSVVHLHNSEIAQGSIMCPNSLSEQRQIASYFISLDRQISAQSSKISKLKQIKSACLDQMFV